MKNLFFYSLLFVPAYGCVPEQASCPQSQKCLAISREIINNNGGNDTCVIKWFDIFYRVNADTFTYSLPDSTVLIYNQKVINDTFICVDFNNELVEIGSQSSYVCPNVTIRSEIYYPTITTPTEDCFALETCLVVETGTLDPSCDPLSYTVQFLVNGALNSYNGSIPSNTIDTILCVPWPNILQPVTGTGGITHECTHSTPIQSYTFGTTLP